MQLQKELKYVSTIKNPQGEIFLVISFRDYSLEIFALQNSQLIPKTQLYGPPGFLPSTIIYSAESSFLGVRNWNGKNYNESFHSLEIFVWVDAIRLQHVGTLIPHSRKWDINTMLLIAIASQEFRLLIFEHHSQELKILELSTA